MTKDDILFAIQEVVAHAGGDWPDVEGEPEVLRRVKMLARMASNRYEVRVKKRDKTWSPWLRLGGGLVHPDVEVQIAAKAEERVPAQTVVPGLDKLRRAFEPQDSDQEWSAPHSLAYPSKAAQIINAARTLLTPTAQASSAAVVMDWARETNDPVAELDAIYAVYEKSMGKPAPDAEMAQIVQKVQHMLFGWWGHHREAIRAALVSQAEAEERVPVVPPNAITASVVRDGGGEHPAFCLMVAYRSEKDATDALNILAQEPKPPASEDVRRARIIAAIAQRWINDTTHLGALVYLNDLAWALNTLAHAPAPPDHVREQAELWRTLMDLPGATRRIWNHVLDDDVKEGANSIREALDAVRQKRGA